MALLSIGDKLGGRYFVIAACDVFDPAARIELRDARGEQVWGQVLSPSPQSSAAVELLARELTAPVAGSAWTVPGELFATSAGIVVAVYRQRPLKPLTEVLEDLAIDPFRPKAREKLIGWFIALAESLGEAHASGATHGAVSLPMMALAGEGPRLALVLSGVGLLTTKRSPERFERAAARADLAALVLALGAAMERASLSPQGHGVARWSLLLQCARGGDHPALASARALCAALRELSSAELLALKGPSVQRPAEGSEARADAVRKDLVDSRARGEAKASLDYGSLKPAQAEPERFWTLLRLRVALLVGGSMLISAAVFALKDLGRGTENGTGPARSIVRPRRAASCGDEAVQSPLMMDLHGRSSGLGAGCSADTLRLSLVASTDVGMVADSRQSRRGGVFEWANTTLTHDATEFGSVLSTSEGVWVSWLRAGGSPFGVARIDRRVDVASVQMSAWPSGAFHRSFLLRADAQGAYLASQLMTLSGPVVTVVRAAFQGSEYPSAAWSLGAGELLAVIPGDSATLLVRQGRRLYTLRIPVTGLSVQAPATHDAGAVPDAGRWAPTEVPLRSLLRSSALELSSEGASAAPEGVTLPGGRAVFLVTDGALEGRVILAEFMVEAEARALPLAERGRGESLVMGRDRAAALYLSGGAPRAVYVNREGEPVADGAVTVPRMSTPRLVSCGAEVWMAFVSEARAGALPLVCVHAR